MNLQDKPTDEEIIQIMTAMGFVFDCLNMGYHHFIFVKKGTSMEASFEIPSECTFAEMFNEIGKFLQLIIT